MTKTELLYTDFIRAHPGATPQEIIDAWKLDKSTVSARLSTMFANGFFTREKLIIGHCATYKYWLADKMPQGKNKQLEPKVKISPEKIPLHRTPESMAKYPDKGVLSVPPAAIPAAAEVPNRGLDRLVDVFVDALACTIADRLKPLVIEKLTASVKNMTEEITREIPKGDKIRLKKVLVCGCLDKQGQMLKQEFKDMLDLDYVTVESAADVWKGKAKAAAVVYVMADFVSHQHIETIKAVGVIPVIYKGGFTNLKDRLLALSIN